MNAEEVFAQMTRGAPLPFQVGDLVSVDGRSGRVTQVGCGSLDVQGRQCTWHLAGDELSRVTLIAAMRRAPGKGPCGGTPGVAP